MNSLANWKPRPAPLPVTLKGAYVTIRPYDRKTDQTALWDVFGGTAANELLRYFACPDFHTAEDFGNWLEAVQTKSGWLTEVFSDNATGKIIGMAHYMRADPANGVVEVGGVAHSPQMQRSPASTEVHYLMAKHVFEDLGYRRYEWKCHNDNAQSKLSAVRLGFSYEGVFRKHMLSRGANRDTAWFAMIDDDWPLIKKAFEAWLDPANFNPDGSQKRRLSDIRAELSAGTDS